MTQIGPLAMGGQTVVNKKDLALTFSKAMKDARESGCDIPVFVKNRLLATVKADGEIVKAK
jgi:tRNA-dihydrouridine synthase